MVVGSVKLKRRQNWNLKNSTRKIWKKDLSRKLKFEEKVADLDPISKKYWKKKIPQESNIEEMWDTLKTKQNPLDYM